eukprot:11199750-Lingulodinium_polyedra.AAC.1
MHYAGAGRIRSALASASCRGAHSRMAQCRKRPCRCAGQNKPWVHWKRTHHTSIPHPTLCLADCSACGRAPVLRLALELDCTAAYGCH